MQKQVKFNFQTTTKTLLTDLLTPVTLYLKIRDRFPNSLLLESSDYHANTIGYSYICMDPVASFSIQQGQLTQKFPDGSHTHQPLAPKADIAALLAEFQAQFQIAPNPHKDRIQQGLFGYMGHEMVQYYEGTPIASKPDSAPIPDLHYAFYTYVIAINHFNNETSIFEHRCDGASQIQTIEKLLLSPTPNTFPFEKTGDKTSNLTDTQFLGLVAKAQEHCQRGDVFQLVLSRRFAQQFSGDEFQVYRALRTINPSPYLFYFDYGDFKIFGSSPEAQLIVEEGQAEIHPIAGTFKRTGNDLEDAALARELANDPKENAEHVMLVDLARNDLSRNGSQVEVVTNREVQFFSHVIHLVSKVIARKKESIETFQVVADTFPAGTLSGAPKPKALELIERYEPTNRKAYGGAIGYLDFEGNFNHAIIIRSFLSQQKTLFYQAGAGLVAASVPENELQEVYNKLGALDRALEKAEQL